MKKVKKYYYNTNTHRFEKLEISWRKQLWRVLGFISSAIVTAIIIIAIAFRFVDSPKEKLLHAEIAQLHDQYAALQQQISDLDQSVVTLEHRDNNIYRSVFESAPLPDSIRIGKRYAKAGEISFDYASSEQIVAAVKKNVRNLIQRIKVQRNSYDTLEHFVESKKQMLCAIPAIQPVSNKNLERLASGFGYRIDPIYKTPKLHTGLDFAAPLGTPIYATGDGRISESGFESNGYGNHVIIDHGYGYQTLYGHMIKIKVHSGEHVKRGQVIGWVGSTGKSTGPHCHYEVIKNGNKIDPIHFFFNDLSATDYERLVNIAAAGNQSFD